MAPKATASTRKGNGQPIETTIRPANGHGEIFVDPMLGAPLSMFVEREVEEADKVIEVISKHGGAVSSGYSNVNYIIVNPATDAGRALARQYASKKGKVVLASNWVFECIRNGELQTFKQNWAGCKMDGYEVPLATVPSESPVEQPRQQGQGRGRKRQRPADEPSPSLPPPMPPHPPQGPMVQPPPNPNAYPLTHAMHNLGPGGPLANWNNLPPNPQHPPQHHPHPQHMPQPMPRMPSYPAGPGMGPPPTQPPQPAPAMRNWDAQFPPQPYPFGYGTSDPWQGEDGNYYQHAIHPFQPHPQYPPPPDDQYVAHPAYESPSNDGEEEPPQAPAPSVETYERGRTVNRASRAATSRQTIAQAGTSKNLIPKRAMARSPTPPTRIMKSTFGGNLFTSEDILYLKKYIDYCQSEGLILSLREICERLAIKAPHHTFYSWRRFCNKHQIKLGAYDMAVFRQAENGDISQGNDDDDEIPRDDGEDEDDDEEVRNAIIHGPNMSMSAPPRGRAINAPMTGSGFANVGQRGERSPTPPKTLYRSTTGKGVAFTEEDVTYLVRYLQYAQGQDMVQVWRDIAQKAPHHSRASWMKYWRRHKHEYEGGEAPPPPQAGPGEPPMKRRRYDRGDDVKLARLFMSKPQGTSDVIFQNFSALPESSHHPWKGWQEHHRIHKAKIDHIIAELEAGTFVE